MKKLKNILRWALGWLIGAITFLPLLVIYIIATATGILYGEWFNRQSERYLDPLFEWLDDLMNLRTK